MAGIGGPVIDMVGKVVERLTVLRRNGSRGGAALWICMCVCGNERTYTGNQLRGGTVKSCGCFKAECLRLRKTTHGFARQGAKSPVYVNWLGMHARCGNPKNAKYADYGGRGITVCERWNSFENFLADMGMPPAGMTLERKRNSEGYSLGNCEWATRLRQSNNMRANVLIRIENQEMTLSDFVRLHGLDYGSIQHKLKRGTRFVAGKHIEVIYPEGRS